MTNVKHNVLKIEVLLSEKMDKNSKHLHYFLREKQLKFIAFLLNHKNKVVVCYCCSFC